jgi:hypothetical protein
MRMLSRPGPKISDRLVAKLIVSSTTFLVTARTPELLFCRPINHQDKAMLHLLQ